ncbi:hypothetical protein A2631_03995 [Candidatus Daviesbacteria bacterium RIFCSPHIGHO2_01_FULL_44_29]|uniref:Uncharacterized protein n=1 Tax=Candidatus Daviesbacteria bacterium RIFCSPHIGHO2_02_FULL_43_12 TaxID=1797776 RepID=A0A1F5KH06_9BACT|nr:MAG: hypothetical protein A2631_03995 [Candidatus Daviesbacteria bacterium RIFCSPHIGHO2_01_FULL_44_29]OGE39891.1 MAG: hypothetical protein A3D25_03725 [Candidatus Daviesbacteria bacterium RIFCSPHIGHO2_02_FULL_43_12]OGE40688.1 MAG: hypothetical protein A3E86_04275 [Candidatus Daviesbacteria bacterium RIFCSPHIGHO2_12_FULL_47_45]OGE70428.1 MAG: hypothetical protein A3B55_01845 [Candidatus Daviesbacteria bacterium RIFCSPLOWO2_01_FULL_43_15]
MTLTETARITKISILALAILVVIGISGWASFQFWYHRYYLPSRPVQVEVPEVKFGVLPRPLFPKSNVSSSNFSYSIDTETGELPTKITQLMKVYFIPQLGTTLLAPNKARILAESLNFNTNPEVVNSSTYQFKNGDGGTLLIDLNNSNFTIRYPQASSSAILQSVPLPDEDSLIDYFQNFLKQRGLFSNSLQKGTPLVTYDKFPQKTSLVATVSIIPADLDGTRVVTPSFKNGLVQATITQNKDSLKLLDVIFTIWEPDNQNTSTYPLKTIQTAFDELKAGKGTVIVEPPKPRVSLATVYLAYFEANEYAQYIQPVYVFEGEEFVAYVPAITDQYLEK